ncbi:MAG: hypothetical protein E7289_00450 [Lachnospiraceae bacterium]|nr:hypothetical protein [Lachnospiraceae bacterium]
MNVNGVSSSASTYTAYSASAQKPAVAAEATSAKAATNNAGVVYEPSGQTEAAKSTTKQDRSAIIQKLKAENEARVNQMTQLVHDMLSKQGNAYGAANDIWKFLASGNFTVDAQTKAQAQADIAEDGYWGVNQTSSRIYDFAMALAGDDEEKMKEMQSAFEKGFKLAEKKWGGELPEISQKTYEAVNQKFEDYFASKKEVVTE